MAKPAQLPNWATSGTVTDPGAAKKAQGWTFEEEPPFDFFNWIHFTTYDWVRFLYDEMLSPIITDVGVLKTDTVDTTQIVDDAVTNDKLANMAALSAKVRASNSVGDPSDVASSADHEVLRRLGTALGFGQIHNDGIVDDTILNAKLADMGAMSVKCNPTNAGANPSDLNAATDFVVLKRSGTSLVFGTIVENNIALNAVTNARLADMDGLTVKGRIANTAGGPVDIIASVDGYVLRRSGTSLNFGQIVAAGIAAGAIVDAKLRDSAALSVIGRTANSSGVPADIAAGVDGQVLRRSGTALSFGTIVEAGIADNAVTLAKLAGGTADRVFGTDGSGDPELAQIATAQIGDLQVTTVKIAAGAVDDTKVSGGVGRWACGGASTNVAANDTGLNTPSRLGNVIYRGTSIFLTGQSDFQIRKNATGQYELKVPDTQDTIDYLLTVVSTFVNTTVQVSATPANDYWNIRTQVGGVDTDTALSFWALEVT